MDKFNKDMLRVSVAQICQTIGYSSTQAQPLELLQDILHRFLIEICRDIRGKSEHAKRTKANLKDAFLTLKSLQISTFEISEYVRNVSPIPFAIEVAKYPVRKTSTLKFLNPGSIEATTRAAHIYRYLPPLMPNESTSHMLPKDSSPDKNILAIEITAQHKCDAVAENDDPNSSKRGTQIKVDQDALQPYDNDTGSLLRIARPADELGRTTRELSSVTMSNSGYIAPAIEGKLSVAIIPDEIDKWHGLDAPPPDPPRPLPQISMENKQDSISQPLNGTEMNEKNNSKDLASSAMTCLDKNLKCDSSTDTHAAPSKIYSTGDIKTSPNAKLMKKIKSKKSIFRNNESITFNGRPQGKAQRKALKYLQKLSKSSKKEDFDKNIKNQLNPAILSTLPANHPERIKLEKLLSKQVKQRQKLLRQQAVQKNLLQKNLNTENEILAAQIHKKNVLPDANALGFPELMGTPTPLLTQEPEIKMENVENIKSKTLDIIDTPEAKSPNKNFAVDDAAAHKTKNLTHSSNYKNREIKLSSEPDRSKLNIFKKISKQKNSKATSPNATNAYPPVLSMYGSVNNSQSEAINLPLDTTITTTSTLMSNQPNEKILFKPSNEKKINKLAANASQFEIPNRILEPVIDSQLNTMILEANKPKKRGRKPGVRNQIKLNPGGNSIPPTKTKKNNAFGQSNASILPGLPPEQPLNLSNMNQYTNALNFDPTFGTVSKMGNVGNTIGAPPAVCLKERKMRKKMKSKINLGNFAGSANDVFGKNEHLMNFSNKHKNIFGTEPGTDADGLGDKNDTYPLMQQNFSASNLNQMSTKLNAFMPSMLSMSNLTNTAAFHKQSNVLPMLPLLPFQAQPGLIPTGGGLFHPSFGHNPTDSGIIMPPYLPFQNLNQQRDMKSNGNNNSNSGLGANNLAGLTDFQSIRNFPDIGPNASLESSIFNPTLHVGNSVNHLEDDKKKDSKKQFSGGNNSEMSVSIANKGNNNYYPPEPKHKFNVDGPIEVSDDSNEVPPIGNQQTTKNNQAHNLQTASPLKPFQLPPMPNSGNLQAAPLDGFFGINNFSQPLKKMKKPKVSKNDQIVTNAFNLEFDGAEKLCLAGGADLIPLPRIENDFNYAAAMPSMPVDNIREHIEVDKGAISHHAKNTVPGVDLFRPSCGSGHIFDEITITPMNNTTTSSAETKRRKEHKKLKKNKEGKIKKKKDKKDKLKFKDRGDDEKYACDIERNKKELEKKLKKEKKKEKLRLLFSSDFSPKPPQFSDKSTLLSGTELNEANDIKLDTAEIVASGNIVSAVFQKTITEPESSNQIPKLTFKLGGTTTTTTGKTKTSTLISFSQHVEQENKTVETEAEERAPSPELARFSPLVTRPPKQKPAEKHMNTTGKTTPNISCNEAVNSEIAHPSNIWLQGGTLSASSVLLPQQLLQPPNPLAAANTTLAAGNTTPVNPIPNPNCNLQLLPQIPEKNRPSSYVDAEGNRIWICPACGKVDDGSPMIGCDGCDAWYHWICVGIIIAPKDNEDWFCRVCITKKKVHGGEKKRKRNKKK